MPIFECDGKEMTGLPEESACDEESRCELCSISYATADELLEHFWSLMHHLRLEARKKNSVHTCTLCLETCMNISLYSKHLNSDGHRQAVADRRKQVIKGKKRSDKGQATSTTSSSPGEHIPKRLDKSSEKLSPRRRPSSRFSSLKSPDHVPRSSSVQNLGTYEHATDRSDRTHNLEGISHDDNRNHMHHKSDQGVSQNQWKELQRDSLNKPLKRGHYNRNDTDQNWNRDDRHRSRRDWDGDDGYQNWNQVHPSWNYHGDNFHSTEGLYTDFSRSHYNSYNRSYVSGGSQYQYNRNHSRSSSWNKWGQRDKQGLSMESSQWHQPPPPLMQVPPYGYDQDWQDPGGQDMSHYQGESRGMPPRRESRGSDERGESWDTDEWRENRGSADWRESMGMEERGESRGTDDWRENWRNEERSGGRDIDERRSQSKEREPPLTGNTKSSTQKSFGKKKNSTSAKKKKAKLKGTANKSSPGLSKKAKKLLKMSLNWTDVANVKIAGKGDLSSTTNVAVAQMNNKKSSLPVKKKSPKGSKESSERGNVLLKRAEELCKNLRWKRAQANLEQLQESGEVKTANVPSRTLGSVISQQEQTPSFQVSYATVSSSTSLVKSSATRAAPLAIAGTRRAGSAPSTSSQNTADSSLSQKPNRTHSLPHEAQPSTQDARPSTSQAQVSKDAGQPAVGSPVRSTKVPGKGKGPLNKGALMKMVNSPRSRKERMQLIQMVKTHTKSQRFVRPRFNPGSVPSSQGELAEGGFQNVGLDNLPDDVREQIEQLVEEEESQLAEQEASEFPSETFPLKTEVSENSELPTKPIAADYNSSSKVARTTSSSVSSMKGPLKSMSSKQNEAPSTCSPSNYTISSTVSKDTSSNTKAWSFPKQTFSKPTEAVESSTTLKETSTSPSVEETLPGAPIQNLPGETFMNLSIKTEPVDGCNETMSDYSMLNISIKTEPPENTDHSDLYIHKTKDSIELRSSFNDSTPLMRDCGPLQDTTYGDSVGKSRDMNLSRPAEPMEHQRPLVDEPNTSLSAETAWISQRLEAESLDGPDDDGSSPNLYRNIMNLLSKPVSLEAHDPEQDEVGEPHGGNELDLPNTREEATASSSQKKNGNSNNTEPTVEAEAGCKPKGTNSSKRGKKKEIDPAKEVNILDTQKDVQDINVYENDAGKEKEISVKTKNLSSKKAKKKDSEYDEESEDSGNTTKRGKTKSKKNDANAKDDSVKEASTSYVKKSKTGDQKTAIVYSLPVTKGRKKKKVDPYADDSVVEESSTKKSKKKSSDVTSTQKGKKENSSSEAVDDCVGNIAEKSIGKKKKKKATEDAEEFEKMLTEEEKLEDVPQKTIVKKKRSKVIIDDNEDMKILTEMEKEEDVPEKTIVKKKKKKATGDTDEFEKMLTEEEKEEDVPEKTIVKKKKKKIPDELEKMQSEEEKMGDVPLKPIVHKKKKKSTADADVLEKMLTKEEKEEDVPEKTIIVKKKKKTANEDADELKMVREEEKPMEKKKKKNIADELEKMLAEEQKVEDALMKTLNRSKRRRAMELSNYQPTMTVDTSCSESAHSPLPKRPRVRQESQGELDEVAGPSQDPMDQVLQISLAEEEMRTELLHVDENIEALQELLTRTQSQLENYKHKRKMLMEKETNLRKKRLEILQGAVAGRKGLNAAKKEEPVHLVPQTNPTREARDTTTEVPNKLLDQQSTVLPAREGQSAEQPMSEADTIVIKDEPMSPQPEDDTGMMEDEFSSLPLGGSTEPDTTVKQEVSISMADSSEQAGNTPEQQSAGEGGLQSVPTVSSSDPPTEIVGGATGPDGCEDGANTDGGGSEQSGLTMTYMGTISDQEISLLQQLAFNYKELQDSAFVVLNESEINKSPQLQRSFSDSEAMKVDEEDSEGSNKLVMDLPEDEAKEDKEKESPPREAKKASPGGDSNYGTMSTGSVASSRFKTPLMPPGGRVIRRQRSQTLSLCSPTQELPDLFPEEFQTTFDSQSSSKTGKDKDISVREKDGSNTQDQKKADAPQGTEKKKVCEIYPDPDSPCRRKLKSKRERNRSSRTVPVDSSSESNVNDDELNDLSMKTKRRTKRRLTSSPTLARQMKEYLHCESSSDVELESAGAGAETGAGNNKDTPVLVESSSDDGVRLLEHDVDEVVGEETTSTSRSMEKANSAGFKITPAAASHVRNTLLKKTQARLKAPAESSIHGQFKGHTMSVTAIQVFKDHVYTGSLDTTARKFDLKSGKCVHVFREHVTPIASLLVLHHEEHDKLFTGSNDGTLAINETQAGRCLGKIDLTDRVQCFCTNNVGILYVGLGNGHVLRYSLRGMKQSDSFDCSSHGISQLALANEGSRKLLLVAVQKGGVEVRDARSGLLLRTLDGMHTTPLAMQVLNNKVYSGSADRCLRCHNINNGLTIKVIGQHHGFINCVCSMPGMVISAGYEGLIRCFDTKTHALKQMYYGAGKTLLTSMAVHKNMVITGNREGQVESVVIDDSMSYMCRFGTCRLPFGVRDHLLHHVLSEHILPNKNIIRCLWKDCQKWIETRGGKKVMEDHIITHLDKDYE